jgi:hypothetical protein
VKFSSETIEVEIQDVNLQECKVEILVSEDGLGSELANLSFLFELFQSRLEEDLY